jgi:hypothetical protein
VNGAWEPIRVGRLIPGDIVRVASDAYGGEAGQLHNQRVGIVVEQKAGDVIINTIDDIEPALRLVRHPAYKLEKRA